MSDKPSLAIVCKFPEEKVVPPKWTSLSCLEEFVSEVRSGTLNPESVMIFYVEVTPDGEGRKPHYWTQNVSFAEQIAYAQWLIQSVMDEWKR